MKNHINEMNEWMNDEKRNISLECAIALLMILKSPDVKNELIVISGTQIKNTFVVYT